MSLSTSSITAGIAALSVSGVTIKDMSGIPEQGFARSCPLMYPEPLSMVAQYDDSPQTFTVAGGYWPVTRTIRYTYLHAQAGTERGIYAHFAGMTAKADLLVEALATLNVTGVDVLRVEVVNFGTVTDPAGGQFFGFQVDVTVRERINA